ncbi:ABC1 kinase family protein [Sphingobium cloacae]|uniref:Ubiquinone biosynthesis protein n=1 Tax=Sphingobium cloacae TaxID=120107 RepID=A0A1E1F0B6_9SPHN|nr:AarF/UbiB family protein [Sphingobium cloacae]BAV63970.1 ubiquinone biosynthesis protein [Sphingobium cloacae]
MLKTLVVAARDRERLAEISAVAARYGLDVLLARLGLGQDRDSGSEPPDLPRRTRQALEALGPTFVKLGQILATRRDLLPDPWVAEFEKLHSEAPTLPFDALRPRLEEALGEPPETAFAHFDTAPLAAASMAQVHRATLRDGNEVVVKIRRPGIRQKMQADLRLITHLAAIVESGSREARHFQPRALVGQLLDTVLEELDFTQEGRNADRLREDLSGHPGVVIPAIHWRFSSETVLVMDYVAGVAPRDGESLRAAGIDPAAIADLGAELVLDMVLVNGRFHGDPHPGNLLCLPGDRLALLDLGLIGHVSARRQQEFLTFILALRSGDAPTLADTLALWSAGSGVARERILTAAEHLTARHSNGPLVLGALVADFFPLLRKEGLVLPPDLALIFKALITMDGVLNAIQPGFDLSEAIQRARGRLVMNRLAASRSQDKIVALLLEASRIADDAPRLLRAFTRKLETEPEAQRSGPSDGAIIAGAKWIAGAVLAAGALVALMLGLR